MLLIETTSSSVSWSEWTSWTTCSRSCNGGIQYQSRTCQGGSTCIGSNYEQQLCNSQSCEVSAVWSSWSSWSGCSATCGGGRMSRTRQCINGNTCSGPTTQYTDCNENKCPGI